MMRQQYHSREVDGNCHIWNVTKLVKLAETFPIITVPLTQIRELDEPYWYQQDQQPTCRSVADHARLIAETDLSHPILLCSQGRVMDGMHRVCRAYMQGREAIKAQQFTIDPEPDYINMRLEDLPYENE